MQYNKTKTDDKIRIEYTYKENRVITRQSPQIGQRKFHTVSYPSQEFVKGISTPFISSSLTRPSTERLKLCGKDRSSLFSICEPLEVEPTSRCQTSKTCRLPQGLYCSPDGSEIFLQEGTQHQRTVSCCSTKLTPRGEKMIRSRHRKTRGIPKSQTQTWLKG
jgi:hypothetical protein